MGPRRKFYRDDPPYITPKILRKHKPNNFCITLFIFFALWPKSPSMKKGNQPNIVSGTSKN